MGNSLLRLGTSAFTADGWKGSFYPAGMPAGEYLSFYAQHFDTVEVDSTFYRIPAVSTVRGWYAKTPPGFIFAAKVPRVITHEKVLLDCDADLTEFLKAIDHLQEKLGPMLLQFGYFNQLAFRTLDDFLARLRPFLKKLPGGRRFALEIRNKSWLTTQLADALRECGIALALIDQSWMPRAAEWFQKFDPITSEFTYVRWLGDRKGIEERTKLWNKTIVDRHAELTEWVKLCRPIVKRGVTVYAYANNHYAGFAPATVALFQELWKR